MTRGILVVTTRLVCQLESERLNDMKTDIGFVVSNFHTTFLRITMSIDWDDDDDDDFFTSVEW
jgi:hypothetical protein